MKPVQTYNLAKKTGVEVIDEFQLILEVFSRHASTREAKLQIELARLRYELARAKEKVRLAKLGEQPGFHGLGKYEVNVYYDEIKRRIVHIERELEKIRVEKDIKRSLRADLGFPVVSLSGYTGAGKSTLFNSITGQDVKVADGSLFTTLSTKISSVNFNGKKALMVDTVGFIDGLPLMLIEAFRSTLEETVFSDVIILVLDCNEPFGEIQRKMKCSLNILRDIGIVSTPIIIALNKIDHVENFKVEEHVLKLKEYGHDVIPISALEKLNVDKLKIAVSQKLRNFVRASFKLPLSSDSLSLISKIRESSAVLSQRYIENSVVVEVESQDYMMDKIRSRVENLRGRMLSVFRV